MACSAWPKPPPAAYPLAALHPPPPPPPPQPLHRPVLGRGRFDEVDPDRALRQRGQIAPDDFLQRGFGRGKRRQHRGLQDRGLRATRKGLYRTDFTTDFTGQDLPNGAWLHSGKRLMTGRLTA